MMKKQRVQGLLLGSLTAAMVLGSTALAEGLTPGVTVEEDAASATGYTATFVYENAEAEAVKVVGTFAFYKDGGDLGVIPEEMYSPYEWEAGMYRSSFGDTSAYEGVMEKDEESGYWTISMPLPSGHYEYMYNVDGAEENLEDPANPAIVSEVENGNTTGISTFDVPYSDKQEGSIDWSFMLPEENTEKGSLTFVNYTDVNGDAMPLGIYLPAGYDAEREEAYKVLYLCHGGGGNETEWFNGGSTDVIFDNLIAAGKVEPTIVVTMNNNNYSWDYPVIIKNQMECIIPFMEENYNVGTEPADRAYAGLSMGGMTTNNMYCAEADQFGYFGIFSGSAVGTVDWAAADVETLKLPVLCVGAGNYDAANMNESYGQDEDITTQGLLEKLDELGIEYGYEEVKGGHDWTTWPQLLEIFATDYLWK